MEQLRKLAATLSARQRWTVLAAALLVGAGLFAFTRWRTEAAFRPLYTALAPEDAGAVVARLKQANVEYRLAENGTAVLAPEGRISELRLQMAVEGLPKTGRMGFELFDQTNFGLTDFAEHVNYRRALEGELERSLGHMAEVEQARVHLTFPKDSVFLESRQPAKASVMLRLRAGASLPAQHIQAICHLAASAVEGLAPESVSVLDTRGNLLNRPRPAAPADEMAASAAALDYRRQFERELALKIRATLDPLLGADRFQAAVSVDCDLTSGEHSEETFDPERSVMLASQKTEDSTGGLSTAGVPGTASNLPRAAAPSTTGRGGVSRRTENVTYQSSRVVKRTRRPQGVVNRISVALLVDQDVAWEGEPPAVRRVLAPPSPEKLKAVRDLVAGVVGFVAERGDQIVVESLPFEATLRAAPPPAEAPPAPTAAPPTVPWPPEPKLLVMGGAAAAILLALLAAAWMLGRRRKKKAAPPSLPGALPPGDPDAAFEERIEHQLADQDATRQRLEEEVLKSLKAPETGTKKTEALAKHLRESIAKDANPSVMVLRGWLNR
jgi:flagellar M-ring protein FliF